MDKDEKVPCPEKRVELDDFFPIVGEYGRYQKLLTWLIVLPACIPCGLQGFNQLFMADDVEHSCSLPPFLTQNTNFTLEQLRALVLPRDAQNETRNCFIRNVDWASLSFFATRKNQAAAKGGKSGAELSPKNMSFLQEEDETVEYMQPISHFLSELELGESGMELEYRELMDEVEMLEMSGGGGGGPSLIPCPNGWDYPTLGTSIVADFDLVCGKEIYPTIALFLFNFGGLFGVFLFGIFSDLVGRKISFFVCLTFEMIGGIGCVFAKDFWSWTIFRGVTGLTVPAIYQIPFIICLELVGQSYRSFVTVMTCLFYVGGMMLLPLIAYGAPDWRSLSLWTTLPFFLYYIYFWLLPESPRWLLAKNRTKEALAVLDKLAKVNGTSLPLHLVEKITIQGEERDKADEEAASKSKPGIRDLFRTPNLRLKTILLTFCWFANATVYIGLSFYGPNLGENAYLSFFLGSAVEIPGYFVCWLLMDRCGRRWPLCLCMIIGGAFELATVLLPEDSSLLLMTFYLIAKLGISASYLMVYPFGGELYPTEVRGVGLGFSAYIGGIGICCIPLINYLGRSHLLMPLIVMGVVSVVGGIASLRLPETLNATLPATIQQGEEFGKDFGWKNCIHCGPSLDMRSGSPTSSLMFDEMEPQSQTMAVSIPMNRMDQIYSDAAAVEPRAVSGRRRGLVRQGSTLEAPTDSKGAIIITPWW